MCKTMHSRENAVNTKFCRKYALIKGRLIKLRAIKEAIREIDVEEAENKHVRRKLKKKYNLHDIEAKNLFTKSKVITTIIKFAHRINRYEVQNEMISEKNMEINVQGAVRLRHRTALSKTKKLHY